MQKYRKSLHILSTTPAPPPTSEAVLDTPTVTETNQRITSVAINESSGLIAAPFHGSDRAAAGEAAGVADAATPKPSLITLYAIFNHKMHPTIFNHKIHLILVKPLQKSTLQHLSSPPNETPLYPLEPTSALTTSTHYPSQYSTLYCLPI
ncbi:hypothetical protein AAC387_Pa03g4152 [Persea americana]